MNPYLSLMIWDAPSFRTWIRTFNPYSWNSQKNEVSLVHGRVWTPDILILRRLCYNLPQFFAGQFFQPPSQPANNLDLQFQHNFQPTDFSSSPDHPFLMGQASNPSSFSSAVQALPTPPSDARDESGTSVLSNSTTTSSSVPSSSVHCKSEPHPSPTEVHQQHSSASWTPMTPPSSASITGFWTAPCPAPQL